MADFHRLTLKNDTGAGLATNIELDGVPVRGCTGVDIHITMDGFVQVQLTLDVLLDADLLAELTAAPAGV